MADFNAQASEYGQVRDKLKSIHGTQLKNINEAYMSLKLISGLNSGFHADETSQKIKKLLDTVSQDLLPALAVVYSQSEKNMDAFVSKIKSIDKE